MKLGTCPKCGSRRVRAGSMLFSHLARLAHGSRRRYCCRCGARWTGPATISSPLLRLTGVLLLCAVAVTTLGYMSYEIWLAPRAAPSITAGLEEDGAEAAEGDSLPAGMQALLGDAGIHSPALAARMSRAGITITEQNYREMRARAGQMMTRNPAYSGSVWTAGQENGQSQDIQELVRRAAAIIKPMGKSPAQFASEIESSDKQTLWNNYGKNFASQAEAAAAYDEFKSRRSEVPKEWPDSAK